MKAMKTIVHFKRNLLKYPLLFELKKNNSKKVLSVFFKLIIFQSSLIISQTALAQTPVTGVVSYYTTATTGITYSDNITGASLIQSTYLYKYGNQSGSTTNDKVLTSLTAGGSAYTYVSGTGLVVKMRRVNNAAISGIRNLKFDEGVVVDSTSVTVYGTYDDDMEHFFVGNTNFNSGSDNIFTNQGDGNGNNNNIERVDVIIRGGIISPDNSKIGLAIFERGNTGTHDPVKVAAILSIDGSGNPTSYSSIISIATATYGATDAVAASNYVIARRDVGTDPYLKAALNQNQAYGGIFIKYSDFGIANNTPIYGYSVIPNDFAGSTPADIVDYTNATFYPTNTDSNNGGIDLVAFTGLLQNGTFVMLPVTLTSFTSTLNNLKVNLNWATEKETNFSRFELERSTDGKNFAPIAIVFSMENTSGSNKYSYTDDISVNTEANFYYRLKMIDTDGRYSYSPVKLIIKKGQKAETDIAITTFPNPATNSLVVVLPSIWQNKKVVYEVVAMNGQTSKKMETDNSNQTESISLSNLAPGYYMVRVTCGDQMAQQKIVKQ